MKNAYHILINGDSGSVAGLGADGLRQAVEDSGIVVDVFECLPPDEFFCKIVEYKNSDVPLLIGGGDGTIKSCAAALMEHKRPFGIIPLGTMNLLARDLDLPLEVGQVLRAYAQGQKTISVDVGMVNNELFLCCVGLGTMPEASEFREEHRSESGTILIPRLTTFTLQQMDPENQRDLKISMDGRSQRLKTSALVISSNQYGPQGDWHGNNFKRKSLEDGVLGIYSAAPDSWWDKLRLLIRLGTGNWQKDPVVKEWTAETVCIHTEHDEELLSLDGETKTVKAPLNFWMQNKSLDLLVPNSSVVS